MAHSFVCFLTTVLLHQYKLSEAVLAFSGIPGFIHPLVTKGTGQPAFLSCLVQNTDVANLADLRLFAPGGSIPLQTNSKYRVTTSITTVPGVHQTISGQLLVANLTTHDTGLYRCVANNSLNQITAQALLEVQAAPMNARVELLPDRTILNGEEFSVNCSVDEDVYPLPTIQLTRNGQLVQSVNSTKNVYIVKSARQTDEGTYACHATNRVNSTASILKNVTIEEPPAISSFCPTIGIIYVCTNQSKTLSCSTTGDPSPTVNITGVHTNDSNKLILASVQLSDAGNYTCTASNSHGSVSETCLVNIGDPPTSLPEDRIFNVTEGDTVTLSCPSSGLPQARVRWFENGYEKMEWNDLENVTFETKVMNNGSITCNISNDCGSHSRTFTILVTVYRINLTMSCLNNSKCSSHTGCVVALPHNQSIFLSAESRSFPKNPPLFFSNSSGKQISNTSMSTVGMPIDAYKVTLRAEVNQVGLYTFHSEGAPSEFIEVIAEPMIVSWPSSPVILTEGNPTQHLECVARSYPCQSEIEWTHEGMHLTSANNSTNGSDGANIVTSMVTVSKYECHELGEYKCVLVESDEAKAVIVDAVPTFVNTTALLHHRVSEGVRVVLDCEVACISSFNITWMRNGFSVFTNSVAHFALPVVTPKDSGSYMCKVTNKHKGVIQRQFHVDVTVEPEITEFSISPINLSQGGRVDLFCIVRGYPQLPTIVWHPLSSNDRNSTLPLDDAGAHRIHFQVTVNRTGNYTCQIPRTDKEKTISVVARLNITFVSTNRNLSVNGTAELECRARAFPAMPSVMWMRNGTVLHATFNTLAKLPDGSISTVSKIVAFVPGDYVCLADTSQNDIPQQQIITVGPAPPVATVVMSEDSGYTTTKAFTPGLSTGKPSSTSVMQEVRCCSRLSSAHVTGISVGVSLLSAAVASLLTYLLIDAKQKYTLKQRACNGDREDRNVEMYARSSGIVVYEDIDSVQPSGHADVVKKTTTVNALYTSVAAGNSESTDGKNMRNNPAYATLSCD